MIPWRERATRLIIAAFATLFVITGWSLSPAVAAPQSSRLTAELATYSYDSASAVTNPAANARTDAPAARPDLWPSSGVLRLVSGFGLAAKGLKGPIADEIATNLPEQLALGSARAGNGNVIQLG
jgi:hypothetical protein